MSEPEVLLASVPASLNQWQRVTNTFSYPSSVFTDIRNGHRSWWLPLAIVVLFSYIFFAAISAKVGWEQVTENALKMNPKSAEQMAQASPYQQETIRKFTHYSIEGSFAASPVMVLVFVALGSAVLLGTINFVFGGKATFGEVFAVWMYATLPGLIKTILGTVVLFTGVAPESFNLNNFAPTNIGAFLNPSETNAALYALATALDFTTIWSVILLGIGLATVAKVKRSTGYAAVFGWWVIIVIVNVGWQAAFS
jgi:hypothetical protein